MKNKAPSDESLPEVSASPLPLPSSSSSAAANVKRNKSILPLFKRRKSVEPTPISSSSSSGLLPALPLSASPRSGGHHDDEEEELALSSGCSPRLMKKSGSASSNSSSTGLAGAPAPSSSSSSPASRAASPVPLTPPGLTDGYVMLAEIFRRNGGSLVLFTDFCEHHYCDELVHCYQDIMEFKSTEKTPEGELYEAANRVSEIYLRYGSNQEVNATVASVHAVQQALKDRTVTRKTLDLLLADITPLLLQELILLKSTDQRDRLFALYKADSRF